MSYDCYMKHQIRTQRKPMIIDNINVLKHLNNDNAKQSIFVQNLKKFMKNMYLNVLYAAK